MNFYKSLSIASENAIKTSKATKAVVGIFQRIDTKEYYVTDASNEIRAVDEFVAQYQNGEILN